VRRCSLVVIAILGIAVSASAAPPPKPSCGDPLADATVVRFRATDGVRLGGAVFGRGPVGVVLAHQFGGSLCQWVDFARLLAKRGYRVLAFDFRGYGTSARALPNIKLDRDVAGAAAALRRRGARSVYLMGASMGGTAVLGAAPAIRPRVAGVVDLSGPVGFGGVDALVAVRRLKSPALFIAARLDGSYADSTRLLYRAAASRGKQLMITGGAEHGVNLVVVPAVRRRVLTFLRG
jgi:pimeloyl-ACP methyl ester carboxylesterase